MFDGSQIIFTINGHLHGGGYLVQMMLDRLTVLFFKVVLCFSKVQWTERLYAAAFILSSFLWLYDCVLSRVLYSSLNEPVASTCR